MAIPIILIRCAACKSSKPNTEFYVDRSRGTGRIAYCKECFNDARPFVPTFCEDCGKEELRRIDYAKHRWGGRCRKCASKLNNTRPEIVAQRVAKTRHTKSLWSDEKKAAFAEHARQQVLRQGGVPNAKSFVREGQEGRRMAGENHHAWKGGIAFQTKEGRSSREALAWRKAVFDRDDYTCQHCGIRGGKLHADHILPWATHKELRFELSNGRTLCIPCHKKTPTYGWHGKVST